MRVQSQNNYIIKVHIKNKNRKTHKKWTNKIAFYAMRIKSHKIDLAEKFTFSMLLELSIEDTSPIFFVGDYLNIPQSRFSRTFRQPAEFKFLLGTIRVVRSAEDLSCRTGTYTLKISER